MSYFTRLDIANRALQHLGVPRISAFTDSSRAARETNFAVDKLRRLELQRSVWTFATKRCVMREIVALSQSVVFATYDATVTYQPGDVVADSSGFLWLSRKATNLAHTPGSEGVDPYWVPYFGPTVAQSHDIAVQYLPGDVVYVSTAAYLCVSPSLNHLPPNATYWRAITGATLSAIVTLAPLGYERDATTLRKIYRLPANWLRMAPQDPKMPAGSHQNVTAGMAYNDWEVEEPSLFTADLSPFVMRFVADQTDVATMHPMFCEVWAARMAIELSDALTQNPDKMAAANALYQRYMDNAQLLNAVEAGTTEADISPPQQQSQQQGGGGR